MSVRLPVMDAPGLETECYHNCRLSAVLADPDMTPWFLSHFVNLKLQTSTEGTFPIIRFEEHVDIYSDVQEETPLRGKPTELVRLIRESLTRHEYVLVFMNWSHFQASKYFGHQDRIHESLIYGFDDCKEVFYALAFDVEGKTYGATEIAYSQCARELSAIFEQHMKSQKWFAFYGFPLVTIANKQHDNKKMDTKKLFFALDRARMKGFSENGESFAMGYFVYEYLSYYFSKAKLSMLEKEYPIWNIMVYKLIQHNKINLLRMAYMRSIWENSELNRLFIMYDNSRKLLRTIRSLSLKYQRCLDPVDLQEIAGLFHSLYEQEKRALPIFLDFLARDRLSEYDLSE